MADINANYTASSILLNYAYQNYQTKTSAAAPSTPADQTAAATAEPQVPEKAQSTATAVLSREVHRGQEQGEEGSSATTEMRNGWMDAITKSLGRQENREREESPMGAAYHLPGQDVAGDLSRRGLFPAFAGALKQNQQPAKNNAHDEPETEISRSEPEESQEGNPGLALAGNLLCCRHIELRQK
jgi:hypothetical protein